MNTTYFLMTIFLIIYCHIHFFLFIMKNDRIQSHRCVEKNVTSILSGTQIPWYSWTHYNRKNYNRYSSMNTADVDMYVFVSHIKKIVNITVWIILPGSKLRLFRDYSHEMIATNFRKARLPLCVNWSLLGKRSANDSTFFQISLLSVGRSDY